MTAGVDIARIAALAGDPGRANMLTLLMDGRAHTASELAQAAGVARPTASGHLAKLEEGGLVSVARQGRHRYFRLASPAVAALLESLMVLGADTPACARLTPRTPAELRDARTCYDHIAGRLGVGLAEALVRRGAVVMEGAAAELTPSGAAFLEGLGVRLPATGRGRRPACRACLDWSERRPHLAGALGVALLEFALAQTWVSRVANGRGLRLTPQGVVGFRQAFGVDPHQLSTTEMRSHADLSK